MTVADLIAELSKLDPTMKVVGEDTDHGTSCVFRRVETGLRCGERIISTPKAGESLDDVCLREFGEKLEDLDDETQTDLREPPVCVLVVDTSTF